MKQALLILFSFFFLSVFSPASAQEECHIDSRIWFTTGYEAQDDYLCTFDWEVVDIQYNPPIEGSGADGTCQVIVDLVGENDERLNTLIMRKDGNSQLWHAGQWVSMAEFEQTTLQKGCALPAVS
jgi:hypothetical protein